jgi:arylsulfatase A-like enzyme/tetratricopeptide (TPR) repeat protein
MATPRWTAPLPVEMLLAAACAPPPPSVLLITLDTTRADRLSPYGAADAQTPAYDRLAAEGLVFTRAYASAPLTIPSHATMFTGQPPPAHGVRDNNDHVLPDSALTLAERLDAAGYRTTAHTSAFPTQARWGFDQGFDEYHDPGARSADTRDFRDERRAEEVVDELIAELRARGGDEARFAWAHLFDAHWPYAPPAPWAGRFPGRGYEGEIAYTAEQVGRLISAWDEVHPRSLVILTADHGEGLGDGGEQTHGFLLHDGTLRVPLIVRGRGVALDAGRVVDTPVSHVDLVPTVLAVLGLPADPSLPGRDLRDPTRGGPRALYAEAVSGRTQLGLQPLRATTHEDGRYTEGAWGAWYPRGPGPQISTDGDRAHPGLPARRAELEALLAAAGAAEASPAALDPEELQALLALGYIAGDATAEAGDVDPRDVAALIPLTWQAEAALRSGELAEARAKVDTLRAGMPGVWGVDRLDARLRLAEGDAVGAAEAFAALAARAPSSRAAEEAAAACEGLGDPACALDWYLEALQHDPSSPAAMAGEVRCLLRLGDPIEARARAEAGLRRWPDHAELRAAWAGIALAEGRVDEALQLAELALRDLPRHPEAWALAADARWAHGDADLAIEALDELLRLDPFDQPARAARTAALLEVGRVAEARRGADALLQLFPDDPVAQDLHAQAHAPR